MQQDQFLISSAFVYLVFVLSSIS